MPKQSLIFIIALVGVGSAIASQETEVMAPVRQFINGFNKGDLKMAQAACIDGIFIIDDFPPHSWSGSEGISKWLRDLDSFEKKHGASEPSVTLGNPRHIDVTGTYAYAVVPTRLSYKKKGQPLHESGLMALVLHKSAGPWRIAAWSWADD